MSLGDTCIVENTAYTAYGVDGEFIDIVSRCVHSFTVTRLILSFPHFMYTVVIVVSDSTVIPSRCSV